jgi:phage terminase large subunit-like protein
LGLGADRWAGAEFWEGQVRTDVTLDYVIEQSEVIDIGIDGGGLDDLLGFAVLGRHKVSRIWLLWTHAWAHPSVLKRRTDIAAQLNDYAQDGDLTLGDKVGDDVIELAGYVAQVEQSGLLDRIGVDPSGLGTILDGLFQVGIPEDKIIGVQQNYKLQGAIKTAELRLAAGTMWHGGQPLMTWCVGNAKSEQRGNALYITKQAAGAAKIDPLMATFNAVSLMALNPEARGGLEEFLMNPIMAGR